MNSLFIPNEQKPLESLLSKDNAIQEILVSSDIHGNVYYMGDFDEHPIRIYQSPEVLSDICYRNGDIYGVDHKGIVEIFGDKKHMFEGSFQGFWSICNSHEGIICGGLKKGIYNMDNTQYLYDEDYVDNLIDALCIYNDALYVASREKVIGVGFDKDGQMFFPPRPVVKEYPGWHIHSLCNFKGKLYAGMGSMDDGTDEGFICNVLDKEDVKPRAWGVTNLFSFNGRLYDMGSNHSVCDTLQNEKPGHDYIGEMSHKPINMTSAPRFVLEDYL